jgi:hypothetical protein
MRTQSPTWISIDYFEHKIGDIAYLVETMNTSNGNTTWSLYERPLHTNQSCAPRLHGWCGETDNRSRTAHGAVKVTALNKLGDRCRITRVDGEELAEFLEKDGYPELIP